MENQLKMDRYDLLIPGPVALDPSVLAEMARPIVPHYGPDWTKYYGETMDHLRSVFQTTGPVFAIPGSGSAGLEAAIASAIGTTDRLLVMSNGFFGERIAEIAESLHPGTAVHRVSVDRPLSSADLEAALAEFSGITAVIVVHSESSSGLLNPLAPLADICRSRGLLLLVDCISSLGGIELDMTGMGIDICISASQKCLEGPPGLALIAVSPSAWDRIKAHRTRGWYLSLQCWERYAQMWADWHPYPITMAVPALRALRVGLERVLQEGLEARWARHRSMAEWIVQSTTALGFLPVFPQEHASPTVVALQPPEGCSADELVARLREESHLLVAGGMGAYKGKAFRVGNMGIQATRERLEPLICALESVTTQGRRDRHV